MEHDPAGADERPPVAAPRRPVTELAVLGVELEPGGVVLGRELDVGGEALPELGVPLHPAHLVALRAVAQVVDAAARHRVVLDDEIHEAEVAAHHAEADVVAVDLEAGRLDDAGVLRRQQVRVGPARIDPGQQQVAAPLDGELAGLRGRRREAGPVADHRGVVGTGQIPHRLEVLGVVALAVGDLGIPVRAQIAPGAGEVGGIHLGQPLPRREDAAGIAAGLLRGAAARSAADGPASSPARLGIVASPHLSGAVGLAAAGSGAARSRARQQPRRPPIRPPRSRPRRAGRGYRTSTRRARPGSSRGRPANRRRAPSAARRTACRRTSSSPSG